MANENVVSIDCFRRRYGFRASRLAASMREKIPLTRSHGLRIVGRAPARGIWLWGPPSKPPDPAPKRVDSREFWGIDARVRVLGRAPARGVRLWKPPSGRRDLVEKRDIYRYLWVIGTRACVPYIAEYSHPVLGRYWPKHTNLTGGGKAYIGGELWFTSPKSLYVSGGSGRYAAIDSRQLELAVGVFRHFGYRASSLGWDDDAGRPRRHWEGAQ